MSVPMPMLHVITIMRRDRIRRIVQDHVDRVPATVPLYFDRYPIHPDGGTRPIEHMHAGRTVVCSLRLPKRTPEIMDLRAAHYARLVRHMMSGGSNGTGRGIVFDVNPLEFIDGATEETPGRLSLCEELFTALEDQEVPPNICWADTTAHAVDLGCSIIDSFYHRRGSERVVDEHRVQLPRVIARPNLRLVTAV